MKSLRPHPSSRFDVEVMSPYGMMVRPRMARTDTTEVPVPVARELAREHRLLVLRGFEDLHHEARTLRTRADLRPGVAESLESLAALAADQESFSEAARLLGAAAALRTEIGLAAGRRTRPATTQTWPALETPSASPPSTPPGPKGRLFPSTKRSPSIPGPR